MTSKQTAQSTQQVPPPSRIANSYYALLGLHPAASPIEIRRAYRELSKRYHPDTTDLAQAIALSKFKQLNEAYATLSSPERRAMYDLKIGYSRINVIQAPPYSEQPGLRTQSYYSPRSAYLDPTDRPLSAGEVFVLFLLGVTFVGCLLLAIGVALIRGDAAFEIPTLSSDLATPELQMTLPLSGDRRSY